MNGLEKVEPGGLITADFINSLIDSITSLNQRVQSLEDGFSGAQGVRITAFNPPPLPDGNGQNLEQVLQIFGDNFAWPTNKNTVTIQNFLVPSGGLATIKNFRPGSKPTMLEFVIPTIGGIATGGTDVTITVKNTLLGSSAQKTYRLRPALPTIGDPPKINKVTSEDGEAILIIGKDGVIIGENFGPTPADNTITLTIILTTGEKPYPAPIKSVKTNISPQEIRFQVPDIVEIELNKKRGVSVELKVGNFPSAEYPELVSVFRLSGE